MYGLVGVPKAAVSLKCTGWGKDVYIHLKTPMHLTFTKTVEEMLPKMRHLCGTFDVFLN